ncbi:MAG TPA: murein transglycosylase A [Rhizomicrobium sp.]
MKRKKPARQRRNILLVLFVLAIVACAGLWLWLRPATPGKLMLVPVGFETLPGWTNSDSHLALAAFRRSCGVILHQPPTHGMGGVGYAGQAGDWRQVCNEAVASGPGIGDPRAWFENRFAAFELRAGFAHDALFTGYYEPEIAASRTRHDNYVTPVYGLPRGLVTVDLGLFRPELSGVRIAGRIIDNKLVPLPDRAEIDTRGLNDAPVLLYARDPVSVFFLHIQGSGRVRFEDNTVLRLAYAGQNGRSYTPIGRVLIASGELDRQHMSMQAIRTWLLSHPAQAQRIMENDQSYVFFRELPLGDPALGSPGSEGVPLTPQASIAVDTNIHPLGVPIFIATQAPAADPTKPLQDFARLSIAQDTGGAINGNLRADIFWGYGDEAESVAGRMKSTGRMFVLLPKTLIARIPAGLLARS